MKKKPGGEVVIRTIAMPADANPNGDIFGGWILSQMDIGAGILAKKVAQNRVVTVAVDSMSFHYPVYIGDTVTCYAHLEKVGNTSMVIQVEAWVRRQLGAEELCVTEGVFTYVAIDEKGNPISVK